MAASKRNFLVLCTLTAAARGRQPGSGPNSIGFGQPERILGKRAAAQRAHKNSSRSSPSAAGASPDSGAAEKMQDNLEKNALTMSESERQKRNANSATPTGTFSASSASQRGSAQRRKEDSKESSNAPTVREQIARAEKTRRRFTERAGRVGEHPHRHHRQGGSRR